MLPNLPLDLQIRVMSYLERGDVYQVCLASRRLNEAATRTLYLLPILGVGCCEERDNAKSTLDAAFNRRPGLISLAKGLILSAGRPEFSLPPPMPNLRNLELIPCPKCQREWEASSVIYLLWHLHNPAVPKIVSIRGGIHKTLEYSQSMEDLGGIEFRESGTLDKDQDFWSYLRQGILISLSITAAGSAVLRNSLNMKHLLNLNVQGISHMERMLLDIKDLGSLEELTMECSLWSQTLPPEKWDSLTCDLPSLRTIQLRTGQYFIGEVAFQRLCELFKCITAQSLALESIYLGSEFPRLNPPFSGEALVRGIIGRHALRSLKVSAAVLPAHVLTQLLTQCPLLHDLHISGSRSDLYLLALSISHATALRDLYFGLDLPASLSDPNPAIEEIVAATHSLRQLTVYMPMEYKWGREITWKWSWEYDNVQGMAIRTTVGPVTRDIETGQMPRMHDPSYNEGATTEGMELDDPAQVDLSRPPKPQMETDVV